MSEVGSNGYEGIASIYVAGRGTRPLVGDAIGAATVRGWAQAFLLGATVLDLGSGPGHDFDTNHPYLRVAVWADGRVRP